MNTIKKYNYHGVHIKVTPQKQDKMPVEIGQISKASATIFFVSLFILGVQLDISGAINLIAIISMTVSGISILTDVYKEQLRYIVKKIRYRKSR